MPLKIISPERLFINRKNRENGEIKKGVNE